MKRKVIQIADSTQLVSLPRKWALKYSIRKGDDIDVEINGNKLVISAEKDQESASCELDLSLLKNLQKQSISATYLKGYDEVKIRYELPEQVQMIQQLLSEFTGYDIVHQSKNNCVIKQISRPSPEEFPNVVNRLFLLLYDTCENIIEGAKTKEIELLESIKFRDQTINKFSNFCLRLINKGRGVDIDVMTSTYRLIYSLKDLGRRYKALADILIKQKVSDKALITFLTKYNELFQNIFRAYTGKSTNKCSETRAKIDALFANLDKLVVQKKSQFEISYCLKRMVELAHNIQENMLVLLL